MVYVLPTLARKHFEINILAILFVVSSLIYLYIILIPSLFARFFVWYSFIISYNNCLVYSFFLKNYNICSCAFASKYTQHHILSFDNFCSKFWILIYTLILLYFDEFLNKIKHIYRKCKSHNCTLDKFSQSEHTQCILSFIPNIISLVIALYIVCMFSIWRRRRKCPVVSSLSQQKRKSELSMLS